MYEILTISYLINSFDLINILESNKNYYIKICKFIDKNYFRSNKIKFK